MRLKQLWDVGTSGGPHGVNLTQLLEPRSSAMPPLYKVLLDLALEVGLSCMLLGGMINCVHSSCMESDLIRGHTP